MYVDEYYANNSSNNPRGNLLEKKFLDLLGLGFR